MSFQAPRIKAKRRSTSNSARKHALDSPPTNANDPPHHGSEAVKEYHLVSAKDAPRFRRPRNTSSTVVFRPGGSRILTEGPGQSFVQVPVVRSYQPLPEQPPLSNSQPFTTPRDNSGARTPPIDPFANNALHSNDSPHPLDVEFSYLEKNGERPYLNIRRGVEDIELRRQRQRQKRERQSSKWAQTVIPALLEPYLELLRVSDSLRTPQRPSSGTSGACLCARRAKLTVICVFLDSASSQIHMQYALILLFRARTS